VGEQVKRPEQPAAQRGLGGRVAQRGRQPVLWIFHKLVLGQGDHQAVERGWRDQQEQHAANELQRPVDGLAPQADHEDPMEKRRVLHTDFPC
jgi:hypothetical protein